MFYKGVGIWTKEVVKGSEVWGHSSQRGMKREWIIVDVRYE